MVEVVTGIFQLQLPMPDSRLSSVSSYLAKTDEGCLLVDCGWDCDEAFDALALQLGEVGVSFSDLRYIAVTHLHRDHYGLVGRLLPRTQAELVIHEVDRGQIEDIYVCRETFVQEMDHWLQINGVPEDDRREMWKANLQGISLDTIAMPHRQVRGGEHLCLGGFDFEVIWTPGHSPGHICLYERSRRVLISGDHVLPAITPHVSMHIQSVGNPLLDYLASLHVVEALPVDVVLPAHEHVFYDLPRRAEEIRKHHVVRKSEIASVLGGVERTAFQIAMVLPWSTLSVAWADLALPHQHSAISETLAHLKLMLVEGTVTNAVRDGVVWYSLVKNHRASAA
ncbi:MAG: MBL fold metallo-hydrolase [Chloroflexota bacterium]|nr:MAG: MBL fold metallo-hydrolase [Chloroflexota bacterium]